MKIAIYGAGKCGEYIISELKNSKQGKVSCSLFIDNNPAYAGKQKLDTPIVSLEDFLNTYRQEVDGVLVAASNQFMMQEMTLSLLNENYDSIYLTYPKTLEAVLPVLNKDGDFVSYIKPYAECKPVLPYLEYHVSDYCNLKCKGCRHFSNMVSDKIYPKIEDFRDSLMELSKRFKNIVRIRLMGGEPFTNPNLCDFIYAAKRFFPYADIRIVTNGLLLPQIDKNKMGGAFRECNVGIDLSQYPPTREMLEKIIEFTEENNIDILISKKIQKFIRRMDSHVNDDYKAAFENCGSNQCHFLRDKRLYLCGIVKLLYENKEFFGLDISEQFVNDNSIDLVHGNEDGWEILRKISFPSEACKYCSTDFDEFDWCISGDNINKEDWLINRGETVRQGG